MPPEKSEIPIQLLVDNLDLLREMYGSETPQKGQIVEIDGYRIEFRGISRTHGMTLQEITILIAISVGTSLLSSATTGLLACWIFSRLSREGKFPVLIGDDLIIKNTSSEIADALTASSSINVNDHDSAQSQWKQPGEMDVMPSIDEKAAMRRVLSGLLEEQLKNITYDLGLASYVSSNAPASELSRSIVQAASVTPQAWQQLQKHVDVVTNPKAIPAKATSVPQVSTKTILAAVQTLAEEKPHSICRSLLLTVFLESSDRLLLLRWKYSNDLGRFGQLLADADELLIASDQYFAGMQGAQVLKGICLVGRGLCSVFSYSSTLERLFIEVADRLVKLTEAQIECDENGWRMVLMQCDHGDLRAAAKALGFESE